MKKLAFILPLLFFVSSIHSITFGQDSIQQKEYKLGSFDELEIMGNFEIKIIHSNLNKVVVDKTGNDIDFNNIEFTYNDNHLTIKYKGSFVSDVNLEMTIYASNFLKEIKARRGAIIRTDYQHQQMDEVEFTSINGGKILANNLNANEVEAGISKGGSIQFTGKGNKLEATVSMGGTIGAVNFISQEVKATVSMGGEIICAPVQYLNAKVTTGGTISYKGEPSKIKQKVTFGGTIEKL